MAYMHMYFGAPGCGKSTYAAKLVKRYNKLHIPVFTNFPVKGAYRLNEALIGKIDLSNCLCIVDEAGIVYNNRDFKSFPKEAMTYFKLHRHYNADWVFFSQGWDDCDKKIRNLCTAYYNMRKLGPFTFIRLFRKRVGIDGQTHQIIDEYFKLGLLAGGLSIMFRPRFYKMFDSWEAPPLPKSRPIEWYPSAAEPAAQNAVAQPDTH